MATILIALGWSITLPPWYGQTPSKESVAFTSEENANSGSYSLLARAEAAETATQPELGGKPAPEKPGSPAAAAAALALFWLGVLAPEQTPVTFAFLGAYFFSLQMLFRRYVRRDLRASAYVAVSMRVVLAVIGTWVAVAAVSSFESKSPVLNKDQLNVMGFVIGVFPRIAWQVIEGATKKFTNVAFVLPSLQTQLPVSDLDGLTVWHEARLEEEDIENIPNMAAADLVELMLNTRFFPNRIIDWVDQAILYTHLGSDDEQDPARSRRRLLRSHGIRTATDLTETYRKAGLRGDLADFEEILPGQGRKRIRSLVDTVDTNPNLELIRSWRGF
jgi:hypothetical protein